MHADATGHCQHCRAMPNVLGRQLLLAENAGNTCSAARHGPLSHSAAPGSGWPGQHRPLPASAAGCWAGCHQLLALLPVGISVLAGHLCARLLEDLLLLSKQAASPSAGGQPRQVGHCAACNLIKSNLMSQMRHALGHEDASTIQDHGLCQPMAGQLPCLGRFTDAEYRTFCTMRLTAGLERACCGSLKKRGDILHFAPSV